MGGGGGFLAYTAKDRVECWECEIVFSGTDMIFCTCCGNPFCKECIKQHTSLD